MKRSELLEAVQKGFGDLGITSLQIGSMKIETIAPKTLKKLVGYGDTIVAGDVVFRSSKTKGKLDSYVDQIPYRIYRITENSRGEKGVLFGAADESEESCEAKGIQHTISCVEGYGGWRSVFRKATQEEVTRWFEERFLLPDGWRPITRHGSARIRFEKGIPVEIDRNSTHHILKRLVASAADQYGFDFTAGNRYHNTEKTLVYLSKQKRRDAPKVRG